MSILEDELKELRERNNELVQKVQFWKMTAAEKDAEKLKAMKEANELRLQLSMMRNKVTTDTCQLDNVLQTASEEALSHLVQSSTAIAKIMETIKTHMKKWEGQKIPNKKWSITENTPPADKVQRVPPLLLDGQLLQPVVSLSRTILSNNTRSERSSLITNRPQAVPMHMLQDVYIPLTRIDMSEWGQNNEEGDENDNSSSEDEEDSNERTRDESASNSDIDNGEPTRALPPVAEEPGEGEATPQRTDNPMEGPSWMLDRPAGDTGSPAFGRSEFTPTVRRRKRAASPDATPRSPVFSAKRRPRRYSNNGRMLKVLVMKMRLDDADQNDRTPSKKQSIDMDRSIGKPVRRDSASQQSEPTSTQDAPDLATSLHHISPHESSINNISHLSLPINDSSPLDSQINDSSPVDSQINNSSPLDSQINDSSPVDSHINNSLPLDSPINNLLSLDSPIIHSLSNDSPVHTLITRDSPINHTSQDLPQDSGHTFHDAPHHSVMQVAVGLNGGLRDMQKYESDSRDLEPRGSTQQVITPGKSKRRRKRVSTLSSFDAPSPNGSTDARVVVSTNQSEQSSRAPRRANSYDSNSDSSGDLVPDQRTRRPRKPIQYKEKPLNRKLRR